MTGEQKCFVVAVLAIAGVLTVLIGCVNHYSNLAAVRSHELRMEQAKVRAAGCHCCTQDGDHQ